MRTHERNLLRWLQRAMLGTLASAMMVAAVSAQVVEVDTTPIDRNGNPIQSARPFQRQPLQQPIRDRAVDAQQETGAAQSPKSQQTPQEPTPQPLNVDPDAPIEDLVPPTVPAPAPAAAAAAQNFGAQNFGAGRQRGLGATSGSYSSAPNMIGDIFGGSFSTFGGFQTVSFGQYSPGTILSGADGGFASTLAFEFGTDIVPNDVFTTGGGSDLSLPNPDGFADSYAIAEPLPPNDALTSPGPGFLFDGGTAVYTNNNTSTTPQAGIYTNGQQWFIAYSYTQTIAGGTDGRPVPGPGVAGRRVKLAENFSPEVRDRYFASYNFFNDAYAGLGDVSRYTLGFERILVDKLVSLEVRMLMAGTYGSTQDLQKAADRNFEFGNAALIGKGVLLRTNRLLWSGGMGVTLPTADDTRIRQGNQDVLVVKNRTVHLLPFTALLYRLSRNTAFQAYMQMDIAANGDPIFADLTGGPLPQIGTFNDSTLMNIDVALSHGIYRNRNCGRLRRVIANAELHYSGTLQASDFVTDGTLTYTNLKRNFNVVNATGGLHFMLGNSLVVTPAMSIPLRSGLDEQFDYEAIVQVNYLR